jgi:hypothetical protein
MITAKICAAAGLALAPLAAAAAPIAWLDEPATLVVMPTEPVDASPALPCRETDLQLTLGGAGAWHGHATQELLLRNRSATTCLLNSTPAVELASPGGWRAAASASGEPVHSLVVPPRGTLAMMLGTPGACDATVGPERRVVRRLRVLAPGGGALEAEGAHVDTTCGPPKILRIDQHAPKATSPAPGSTQLLTAELNAPREATAGAPLDYLVTLKNPSDQPIALSPCPGYQQVLNTASAQAGGTLRLNCAGAGGVVPAHGERQFEMRALVPEAAGHEGGVKLSWRLADGPAVGTVIPLR